MKDPKYDLVLHTLSTLLMDRNQWSSQASLGRAQVDPVGVQCTDAEICSRICYIGIGRDIANKVMIVSNIRYFQHSATSLINFHRSFGPFSCANETMLLRYFFPYSIIGLYIRIPYIKTPFLSTFSRFFRQSIFTFHLE